MRLKDKTAIITGASSGIGREAALRFAAEGANVVVGARRSEKLKTLVGEIKQAGGTAVFLAGDVCSESYARSLVELAVKTYGSLDIGFNNAGTLGAMGDICELDLAAWNGTLETNLTSGFLAAKYQLPEMLKTNKGSLIFTSTFVGHSAGMPGMSAYAASKAGLLGLTQTLAAEYGPRGVRVNALLPGGTDTDMGATVANTPEIKAFVESLHALKRTAAPQEIANAALFLASDDSSFMTGEAMLVDGGVSINRT